MQIHDASGSDSDLGAPLLSEINVTPFVDVMLVLLIIFMVAAPMVAHGVDVNLPKSSARQIGPGQGPIEVSIDANKQISVGKLLVAETEFSSQMRVLASASSSLAEARVLVRADTSLDYGYVMGIVSQVSDAGFVKVAFLTDPKSASRVGNAP